MRNKPIEHMAVQDLCRTLKQQLDTLELEIKVDSSISDDERRRRRELMLQLKKQLAELSV